MKISLSLSLSLCGSSPFLCMYLSSGKSPINHKREFLLAKKKKKNIPLLGLLHTMKGGSGRDVLIQGSTALTEIDAESGLVNGSLGWAVANVDGIVFPQCSDLLYNDILVAIPISFPFVCVWPLIFDFCAQIVYASAK